MQVKKDEQGIYDFDVLVSKPRLARVGGEVIDVSIIPVAVTLAMAERDDMTKEEIRAMGGDEAKSGMLELFQLMSDVCRPSNPKVTRDFLMEHLNPEKFVEFMKFVMHPAYDKVAKILEGDEGNAKTDDTSSD